MVILRGKNNDSNKMGFGRHVHHGNWRALANAGSNMIHIPFDYEQLEHKTSATIEKSKGRTSPT